MQNMEAFAVEVLKHHGGNGGHNNGTESPIPLPPHIHHPGLSSKGANFAWFVYFVMLISALVVTIWGLRKPSECFPACPIGASRHCERRNGPPSDGNFAVGKRAFHWVGASLLFTAAMSYYAMATAVGVTQIEVRRHGHAHATRSIYYARYIDWTVTTPLLLLELLLATNMPSTEILFAIMLDLFMIIGGLIGSVTATEYKWGWFTGATIAMLFIFYLLMVPARKMAYRIGEDVGRPYTTSTIILLILWTIYPIVWGVADGAYVISVDTEMIAYGILDLLAKPVFLFVQ
jgi:hypothetical protein